LRVKEKKKKKENEKEKKRGSFETYSRIPTLLVSRNVATQAPFDNNTSSL
jgi:hypothetical protein